MYKKYLATSLLILTALSACVRPLSTLSPLAAVSPIELAKTPTARPTLSPPGNLLQNPSFEGDYVEIQPGVNAPPPWSPAWDAEGPTPEYGASEWWAHYYRIRSGQKAAKIYTAHKATDWAGLVQTVSGIAPGTMLEASVWAHAWSGYWCPNTEGFFRQNGQPTSLWSDPKKPDPCHYDVGASEHMKLCVGFETGEALYYNCEHIYDDYARISVTARALSSDIQFRVWYANIWAFQIVDAYFDDASLVIIAPTPTPTIPATNTPTVTPTPQSTPTRTPVPQGTPVVSLTVTAEQYAPIVYANWRPTPEPTMTPTPTPTPTLPVVGPAVVLRFPDVVTKSTPFVGSVFLLPVTNTVAFEARAREYHNAVDVMPITATIAFDCDIERLILISKGVVRLDCESTNVIGDLVRFADIVYTIEATGVYTFDVAVFFGKYTGWGGAVIERKRVEVR